MMTTNNINTLYQSSGFKITQANMDVEIEPIRAGLLVLGINLNTVSHDEHVPGSERNVRTVKDQARSVLTTSPFPKVPDRMIIDIVLGQVFWLNVFTNKYVFFKTMSTEILCPD